MFVSRFAFLAALIVAAPAFAEARYFSELPDLPLPPGFTETNTAAGFDGAHGRLVVADAMGVATSAQVQNFYAESLPALGWSVSPTNDGTIVFVRGREELRLELTSTGGRTHVHVQLIVRPAPSNGD
jgi:hypothetical protein